MQNVNSFAAYLTQLEADLLYMDEIILRDNFFIKLRPELRRAITNIHKLSKTRDNTVALAYHIETNILKSQDKSIRSQCRDIKSISNQSNRGYRFSNWKRQ